MPLRTFNLTIDRLAYSPAGVGRVDGKVIFVPGTVPGDKVEVVLDQKRKSFALGHIVTLHKPSRQRRQPPCPYVSRCGGCPWQQVAYPVQLSAKEMLVHEHLRRIAKIPAPPVLPIIPAPDEWHYRHRIRLRTGKKGRLGFSPVHSHEVVEIESCVIAERDIEARLRDARAWLAAVQTPVSHVELVLSDSARPASKSVLIGEAVGVFQEDDDATCINFLHTYPQISGIIVSGQGWRRVWGDPTISFDLDSDGTALRVSRGSFTQVNLKGNRTLIATLLRLGDFCEEQRVIELYCGAGNLSLPIARRVQTLVGVEQDRDAIADARANAARLGQMNVRFLRASARTGIQRLLRNQAQAEVVVLDPPRAGALDVIDMLPRLGARKVVYVSCDPTTLARDLRRLEAHGYRLQVAQPIDLFPQTYHVETIAVSVLTC